MTKEQILELLELCLEINGLEERKRTLTGNLPTVGFDFSGHTSGVYIRVYEHGWEPHMDPTHNYTLYTNMEYEQDRHNYVECIKKLKQLKKALQSGNSSKGNNK